MSDITVSHFSPEQEKRIARLNDSFRRKHLSYAEGELVLSVGVQNYLHAQSEHRYGALIDLLGALARRNKLFRSYSSEKVLKPIPRGFDSLSPDGRQRRVGYFHFFLGEFMFTIDYMEAGPFLGSLKVERAEDPGCKRTSRRVLTLSLANET